MDQYETKDMAESRGSDDQQSLAAPRTSWLKGGFAKVRESRAYTLLVRPNALSIVGAGVGIVSMLFLNWGSRQVFAYPRSGVSIIGLTTEHLSFFDMLTMSEPAVSFALSMFLIGTVFGAFVPILGFLQGAGLLGFIVDFDSALRVGSQMSTIGPGYYLAMASAIMVMGSCLHLYAWRGERRAVPVTSRIMALSPYGTRLRK